MRNSETHNYRNDVSDRHRVEVIRRNQRVNSSNGDNKDYFDHSYIRNPNN